MKLKKLTPYKWDSNFSYAIGLLTTDGSLSADGRHFDFTSKDKDLVKLFLECLGKENKIGRKTSGYTNEKKYFRVQFGDINFYKWCLTIGLTPNKSTTLKNLKIPDKFLFDFLRGCFDGDGSIYAYWDPRWHSSYMFYLQLASASPKFLEWLQKNINRLLNIKGHITTGHNVQQLRYAKKETLILFNQMYHNKNAPFLKRKFIKAQKIFNINQKHNNPAQVS